MSAHDDGPGGAAGALDLVDAARRLSDGAGWRVDSAGGPGDGAGRPDDGADWDDPERELTSSIALFEGDEGRLELPQRRALVVLLKHRFITGQSHPAEWKTLTANPRPIRSRLNDMFLELRLHTDVEVAYKSPVAPEGGGRFPTLLHDSAWTREETILLVYLRTRSRSEDAAGTSRTLIERQDMLEHVAAMRPAHATDQAGDARRAAKAIENLNRAGLLVGPSTADRFEVSRAIDVVLPLERLQDLLRWLTAQHTAGTGADNSADGSANDPSSVDDPTTAETSTAETNDEDPR